MLMSMVLFWGLIIAGTVFLARLLSGSAKPSVIQAPQSKAIEILRERYAKGEIDKDEYDERISVLRS